MFELHLGYCYSKTKDYHLTSTEYYKQIRHRQLTLSHVILLLAGVMVP